MLSQRRSISPGSSQGKRLAGTSDAQSWHRPRFLTEREAATYLGLSPAGLAELRLRDLAMIARGSAPLGPPALWRAGRWCYATETLDEWRSRPAAGDWAQRRSAGH